MFGKKKETPQIDKEQLELIETAQKRIKQKKRLYAHFVVFLIGAVFLIVANLVLNIGKDVTFLGIDWFVFAILAWLFLFVYHLFNVFVTSKMLSKKWEEKQLNKLVEKQKERIAQLQQQVEKDYPLSTEKKRRQPAPRTLKLHLLLLLVKMMPLGKTISLFGI